MKKGISLIVLVITIIVMIIIASAIIMSLTTNNIMDQADTAVEKSNRAEVKSIGASVLASNLYYASGDQYLPSSAPTIQGKLDAALLNTGFTADYDEVTKTIIYTDTTTPIPHATFD